MTISLISFTDSGEALARTLARSLPCAAESLHLDRSLRPAGESFHPEQPLFCEAVRCEPPPFLEQWTAKGFAESDALVFIGAAGIAVRAIAPHIRTKAVDPAVVAVDEGGRWSIPLLSGHLGGANDLARQISAILGGEAVITTATDGRGVFAVDQWARYQGCAVRNPERIKAVSGKLLAEGEILLWSAFPIAGTPPEGVRLVGALPGGVSPEGVPPEGISLEGCPECDVLVSLYHQKDRKTAGNDPPPLHLIPRIATLGIGCKRGTDMDTIDAAFQAFCRRHNLCGEAVRAVCTIDRKGGEPGLLDFCAHRRLPLRTFSAEALSGAAGLFSGSGFVLQTVGVDNVCERSAVLGSGGTLILRKEAENGVTLALAVSPFAPDWHWQGEAKDRGKPAGKVYAVGIGPGAPDHLTPAARSALSQADVLCGYGVYTGLIRPLYPDKAYYETPMGGEVRRCRCALDMARSGKTAAVVCGGDPGIYSMAGLLIELGASYPEVEIEVIPGVTAALAGAAVLGAPLEHDFCVLSLSDLLTPWETIEQRLRTAAAGDFILCLYNPASRHRAGHLRRACEILLEYRDPETVCGWVRKIARAGQSHHILTLRELKDADSDMFTTVFIGSRATVMLSGRMVTPRGYCIP